MNNKEQLPGRRRAAQGKALRVPDGAATMPRIMHHQCITLMLPTASILAAAANEEQAQHARRNADFWRQWGEPIHCADAQQSCSVVEILPLVRVFQSCGAVYFPGSRTYTYQYQPMACFGRSKCRSSQVVCVFLTAWESPYRL